MKRYQIWITHSILLIGLVFCIIFAQVGCGDTVIPDSIYEEKVTVHFTDTIEVFHGSNVRLATGAIYIDDCKEFNEAIKEIPRNSHNCGCTSPCKYPCVCYRCRHLVEYYKSWNWKNR